MEAIYYGKEEQKVARQFVGEVERATQATALDGCVGEADIIREQIAEVGKLADYILERLAGPRPETECCENVSIDPHGGGRLGDLSRIQATSIGYLADLRLTVEQLGEQL